MIVWNKRINHKVPTVNELIAEKYKESVMKTNAKVYNPSEVNNAV